ncbi:MAG: MBL fold metallo-hydrolase [Anaerovoracaceae bacterium]|nr:MBL fold metallo-hydrolase [Clostridiales bacterium]MDY2934388.1 MBL fold metallo-hydrolase [Anaerovoracaceae bacterium]
MKIKFCGAAAGVTGSCHLLSTENHKILLDCGQFQGGKAQDALNEEPFPFDPAEIECVVLSHAHIDHCGRLPLLVKRGFRGAIYCTDATADLLEVMLKDSGFIHEKEAEWQSRKNERAGRKPVEPLYTVKDSEETLKYVRPVMYDQLFEINDEMKVVFNDAGHILGSAIIELWTAEDDNVYKTVFSGDLGVLDRPILRDPTIIKKADYVIMESTYGNRLHPENATSIEQLLDIVIKTTRRGGTVVIPSFAVGRTQELIYEFNRFYLERPEYKDELEKLTVYIDSPMATSATEVFRRNAQVFDEETKAYILKGDNPLDFPNLRFTRSTAESQALNMDRKPKIIISASGMCEAGRIRHHLKHNLWDPKSSVIFVGYQAEGTLGRMLTEGQKDVVLFGEAVHVNAEIYNLEGFSGHADKEGLLGWLSGFKVKPKQLFLVHGELESKEALAASIRERLGYDPVVVTGVSEFELKKTEIVSKEEIYEDAIDNEAVEATKQRIIEIHDQIENLLYNTGLVMGEKISPEKMSRINDLVLALQKDSLNLGSVITSDND